MDGYLKKPDYWEETNSCVNVTESNIIVPLSNTYPETNIVVLAGGIDNSGNPYQWVKNRLDLAIDLFKTTNTSKIFCLGGGSYHKKPITNKMGYLIHESTSCSEYLISHGIPSEYIIKEWSSYDTIANGFFFFCNYVFNLNIKDAIIITSEFHIERSKYIFNFIKSLYNSDIKLTFKCTNDENVDNDIITARKSREEKSLSKLKTIWSSINTIKDFTTWFFCVHKAYCSNSELIREDNISEKERRSY